MPTTRQASYDDLPYHSHPWPQTHPDQLATVAALLGMKPPPVEACRVLELGCASGGNLLPMALTLPQSTFVGIDFSGRQIAEGQRVVETLGLGNIQLKQLGILDVDAAFGEFDYILCHGVYSWVANAEQDKILQICSQHLAANGVAYISYNTYPGWHMRRMLREMMLYHAYRFEDLPTRVGQARALLEFLAQAVAGEQTPQSLFLRSEQETLRQQADSYLLHEHLDECNEPLYFHEFVERAAARGLRYLGEAELPDMMPNNFRPEVAQALQKLSSDVIQIEQYMDFLRNRMFRQTLLCHQHMAPSRLLRPESLRELYVAARVKPVATPIDLASMEPAQFQGPRDITLSCRDPIVKAAMVHLWEAGPRPMAFADLRTRARLRLSDGADPDAASAGQDAETLGHFLLTCYARTKGLVELHICPPCFVLQLSECPLASPLARLQAQAGNVVTNLRHEESTLDEIERQLLPHLDGEQDRAALLGILADLAAQGTLLLRKEGIPIQEPQTLQEHLPRALEQQLRKLAWKGLLMG